MATRAKRDAAITAARSMGKKVSPLSRRSSESEPSTGVFASKSDLVSVMLPADTVERAAKSWDGSSQQTIARDDQIIRRACENTFNAKTPVGDGAEQLLEAADRAIRHIGQSRFDVTEIVIANLKEGIAAAKDNSSPKVKALVAAAQRAVDDVQGKKFDVLENTVSQLTDAAFAVEDELRLR